LIIILLCSYTAQKKFEDVRELLTRGATMMLDKGQLNEGTDLALLLLDHYTKNKITISPETCSKYYKLVIMHLLTSVFRNSRRLIQEVPRGLPPRQKTVHQSRCQVRFGHIIVCNCYTYDMSF